jgi:hypothetical protein
MYFPGLGIGRDVVLLVLWLAVGFALTAIGAAVERRRAARTATPAVVAAPQEDAVEEELEQAVAA